MSRKNGAAPEETGIAIDDEDRFPEEIGVEVDGFHPDERHWKYLRVTATRIDEPLTVRDIGAKIGVPFQTVWEWQQNAAFQEWVSVNRGRWLKGQIQNVYSVLLSKAYSGNIGAARLFLQRYDPDFDPRLRKEEEKVNITDGMALEFFTKRFNCTKGDILMLMSGKARIEQIEVVDAVLVEQGKEQEEGPIL